MQLVKIPDTSYVRDINSMALINTDEKAKNEYESKVQMMRVQKDEINKVKTELNDIKKDMVEIKQLMLRILDKSNG